MILSRGLARGDALSWLFLMKITRWERGANGESMSGAKPWTDRPQAIRGQSLASWWFSELPGEGRLKRHVIRALALFRG